MNFVIIVCIVQIIVGLLGVSFAGVCLGRYLYLCWRVKVLREQIENEHLRIH
jgi:hypothetical protein